MGAQAPIVGNLASPLTRTQCESPELQIYMIRNVKYPNEFFIVITKIFENSKYSKSRYPNPILDKSTAMVIVFGSAMVIVFGYDRENAFFIYNTNFIFL